MSMAKLAVQIKQVLEAIMELAPPGKDGGTAAAASSDKSAPAVAGVSKEVVALVQVCTALTSSARIDLKL